MTPAAPPPDWRVAPYFIVEDVVATANYYRDKLEHSAPFPARIRW